jgi:hypothetical protein
LGQADGVVKLTRAVARFFEEPSEPSAVAARSFGLASREQGRTAASAIKAASQEPRREDWLALSRSLSELGERAARAVSQAKLFGVERRAGLAKMARELGFSAETLNAALLDSEKPESCVKKLVESKRRASSADISGRRGGRAALDNPGVVEGLKDRAVYDCLLASAQAAQDAADRIAQVLAQKERI